MNRFESQWYILNNILYVAIKLIILVFIISRISIRIETKYFVVQI